MKISTNWLREWVRMTGPAQAIADRLTMAGLEVDSVTPAAPPFTGVVVAEIVGCEPHPQAERLQVCKVNSGAESLQIVCGAPNARAGLKVPLATVGAALPDDLRIKKAKLRGVESFGMLCSARELGLSEDAAGLLELPADAPVGANVRDYLGLDDFIIEADLTPNRSDCLSMRGIAREVGALTDAAVEPAPVQAVPASHDGELSVRLDAPAACPRYVGRLLRGVDNKVRSPIWLQERLRRAGVRSLSLTVDVTNYVMLELGQPMHAFDSGKLQGGIVVRQAVAGESLALLNGETVELREDTLVIADEARALALAGVMGGESSAVDANTRDIFLESAFFAPTALAGRARQHGLHTESSHRFERGVDPTIQRQAIERATQLIVELAGGEPGPVVEAVAEAELPEQPKVKLRAGRVRRLLGVEIPAADVEAILARLGMQPEKTQDGWQVQVPSFRFDIALEVDLIEELARVWGYNRIPVRRSSGQGVMAAQSESRVPVRRLRHLLADRGYQEAITYSFVEPSLQEALDPEHTPVALANPISADLSVMRTSLWPGLVRALLYNQNRQQQRIRLFETGLRFRGSLDDLSQAPVVAGVATGLRHPEHWGEPATPVDFYDVKADVEALLALSGEARAFSFQPETHPALHPGQSARIYRGDMAIGWLGALHPEVAKRLDLAGRTFVFELGLSSVSEARVPRFAPSSRFQANRRDLAVLVPESVAAGELIEQVEAAAGELLQDAFVFDIYRGAGIGTDRKSLAIGLILQHSSRTLTDEDVDGVIARVVERLKRELGATLRE
jgi:phenylalanyl-tRNA synthetase beta chain